MKQIDVDKVLEVIRGCRDNIPQHWLLDAFRRDLMRGDVDAFWLTYEQSSMHNTEDFDFVVDETFTIAGAKTIDEFVDLMN